MKKLFAIGIALLIAACQSDTLQQAHTPEQQGQRVIRVVTSGGFAAAYNLLEERFEEETGIDLQTAYGSSSGGAPDSIPMRLASGEAIDVIILSQSSLNNLTGEGEVEPDSRVDLVYSMIGMAVKSGSNKPDISTRELFEEAIITAESIGYSASASGTYLSTVLFPKMGVWEQVKDKSKRILSERVASVVARGEVEIGFQQISEILPIEGADYVGPIPHELQKVTTFSTGITKRALNKGDAKRLIEYLSSKEVAETIASTGLTPVVLEKGN